MLTWILLSLPIALFAFFLLFGYFCFVSTNVRRKHYPADRRPHGGGVSAPEHGERRFQEAIAFLDDHEGESLCLTSKDGLRLCARLIEAESEARGTVICLHGYHSSARRDLAVQAHFLHDAGYHVLLVSQRAHGESEGKYICFGIKEREDALGWCQLMRDRFPALPIALLGLSMGASTALFASALALPSEVRAVIADCGFTSPSDIIRRTLRHKYKLLPSPTLLFMSFWSRLLAGFDYNECAAPTALVHSRLPILLIHGSEDRLVPMEMSERSFAAAQKHAELFIVDGARHAQSVLVAPEEYQARTLSFLHKHGM